MTEDELAKFSWVHAFHLLKAAAEMIRVGIPDELGNFKYFIIRILEELARILHPPKA